MPTWVNADGLTWRFGRDEVGRGLEGPKFRGGMTSYPFKGSVQSIEYVVDSTDFTATVYPTLGVAKILTDGPAIPAGWKVDSAEFLVETAFAGATATFDVGTVQTNRTTEIDFDGIFAGVAVASMTAGALLTGGGAQVRGANLAAPALLMVRNNTARFTAGRGLLRVFIYNPTG